MQVGGKDGEWESGIESPEVFPDWLSSRPRFRNESSHKVRVGKIYRTIHQRVLDLFNKITL